MRNRWGVLALLFFIRGTMDVQFHRRVILLSSKRC